MAKPTTYATPICIGLSILAMIGIILGWLNHNALILIILLLPAVIYEIYRTEGESTKWASWVMLIVILAEIWFIWKNVSFDLANYFGTSEQYVGGFWVPLGDIKIIAPIVMAVLSGILFFRTNGKYTKWLAVIIFVSAGVAVYIINPEIIKTMLPVIIQQGLNRYY